MPAPLNFRDALPRDLLYKWWCSLERDRGGRAELRRCRSEEEVPFVPAFHSLLGSLERAGLAVRHDTPALARVAGLAANVRTHRPAEGRESVGAQLGAPKGRGLGAPVSELRFRRLLAAEPGGDLYQQMRRALALVDGAVDLSGLADAVYSWAPAIRKRWAYDYFAKASQRQAT